jgi:2-polyprenyl-3-methyl-5-hydroxy-6-metoxy-1,4-benzoquinol methylase
MVEISPTEIQYRGCAMTEGNGASAQNTYSLATGAGDPAARLHLLDEIYGASTRQMMLEAGLKPGMRVADMACGVGTVACWIAEQVGPTGKVVAVDISSAQLDVARGTWKTCHDLPEIDFVEASAYATGMPSESFDIVHARLLLCHLDQPDKALREFHRLLKPGGVVVCHELHVSGIVTCPPCSHHKRSIEIANARAASLGVSYDFGLKLPLALIDAGFRAPVVRMETPIYLSGPRKSLWEWTFVEACEGIVSDRVATAEEVAAVIAGMRSTREDERVLIAQWPMVGTWAKK